MRMHFEFTILNESTPTSQQRHVVTLIAADRFLVKQGLLTGEPTLQAPARGEKLIPAPQ